MAAYQSGIAGFGHKLVFTAYDRLKLLEGEQYILIDQPAPFVSRITLNRPEKRNSMNHEIRAQLFNQLQLNDQNPEVRVTIIRGAGSSFCSGYDLTMNRDVPFPMFEAEGLGSFQRNVVNGWLMMMDLAKPVIAQVHGYCLAGGTELAGACDLVYCAESAKIGYPPIKSMGLPDTQFFPWLMGMRKAMLLMLTGDNMTGVEAAQWGWATGVFPDDELEKGVLAIAMRVARIPSDLQAFNKKSVHRAAEAKGMRACLKSGADLQALSFESPSSRHQMKKFNGRKGSVSNVMKETHGDIEDNNVSNY